MTVKELSQLYYLKREIRTDEKRMAELEAQREASGIHYDGFSHGGDTESKTEALAIEITDLNAIIYSRRVQAIHEQARLERYITSIPDSLTREIFKYRFISGLSWRRVAERVSEDTLMDESTVRKICYRYLKHDSDGTRNVIREDNQ